MTPDSELPDWPGQRLGLPETGPRSVARIGRRLAAIAIDWGIAVLISVAFFDYDPLATLAVFVGMQILFTIVVNASVGHLLLGMRVVPMAGGLLGVWRPLHDRAAGTILLRR